MQPRQILRLRLNWQRAAAITLILLGMGALFASTVSAQSSPGETVGFWTEKTKRPTKTPRRTATLTSIAATMTASVTRTTTATSTATGKPRITATGTATATATAMQPPLGTSHAGRYTIYEGSKTCNACHLAEANDVHSSLHYQWHGETPYAVGLDGGGKMGAMNDFCGYPDINFIGQLVNLDGQTVDGGCSICHVGLGVKPAPEASQAQLENIDCLTCHSVEYRRKVTMVNGQFRFVPAPERMSVDYMTAITDVTLPGRATCVACHAYAGGGCNNKRGDIESAHIEPPSADFDVHMASTAIGGAGLVCTDCHIVQDHRIAGRGSDMRATDLDVSVRCTNCHEPTLHEAYNIDIHIERVDCTVCHIPVFAKIRSTDMFRDFRFAEVEPTRRLYEPLIIREANVIPEYLFWNGFSTFYEYATPAIPGESGRVLMSGPVGDISDPTAKLFAFKHHQAMQPYDLDTNYIIPVRAGILFQTGNIDQAIRAGATAVGWPLNSGYDFVPTERYMGIFHEVSPADQALACSDCHFGGVRMDFDALGYTPKTERDGEPLCASCHEDKSDEWSPGELFQKVHDKHVKDKRIECSECHTF